MNAIYELYLVGCKDTVLDILDKHLLFLQGPNGKQVYRSKIIL